MKKLTTKGRNGRVQEKEGGKEEGIWGERESEKEREAIKQDPSLSSCNL